MRGVSPAGLALPAAGDPWARPERMAPPAGEDQDLQEQMRLGFEHREYGEGNPRGDSQLVREDERVVHTRHRQ